MDERDAFEEAWELVAGLLEPTVPLLLATLNDAELLTQVEEELIENEPTSQAKLVLLKGILREKPDGSAALMRFAVANRLLPNINERTGWFARFCTTLIVVIFSWFFFTTDYQRLLDPKPPIYHSEPRRVRVDPEIELLRGFQAKLSVHYMNHLAFELPAWSDQKVHIKDTWIPLKMSDGEEESAAVNSSMIVDRLKSNERRHVALVVGEAGTGKTALLKRIAYDWAYDITKSHSATEQMFDLLLIVPLQNASGLVDSFEQLSVTFYSTVLDLDTAASQMLASLIRKLGHRVLICLDGLDEFEGRMEGPLRDVIQFSLAQVGVDLSPESVPSLPYKLLITSRPYPCDLEINQDLVPFHYAIHPLDLSELAHGCCSSRRSNRTVVQHLRSNGNLDIDVPLLLTFVCFLAESNLEIPTNFTSLFNSLTYHTLQHGTGISRNMAAGSLEISANIAAVGLLAFRGLLENQHVFSDLELQQAGVANAIMTSRFMQRRKSCNSDTPNSEFHLRSMQEFLAALYCVKLLEGSNDTPIEVPAFFESQFNRFLCGLLSRDHLLHDLLDRVLLPQILLAKSFDDHLLTWLSASLSDCSAKENGLAVNLLFSRFKAYENEVRSGRFHAWSSHLSTDMSTARLSDKFRAQLNLIQIPGGWFMYNTTWKRAAISVVTGRIDNVLFRGIEFIDLVVWTKMSLNPKLVAQIPASLPCGTLVIQYGKSIDFELNFRILYDESKECVPADSLRFVSVGFSVHNLTAIRNAFALETSAFRLSMTYGNATGRNGHTVLWANVTVRPTVSLDDLVRGAMSLSFIRLGK